MIQGEIPIGFVRSYDGLNIEEHSLQYDPPWNPSGLGKGCERPFMQHFAASGLSQNLIREERVNHRSRRRARSSGYSIISANPTLLGFQATKQAQC